MIIQSSANSVLLAESGADMVSSYSTPSVLSDLWKEQEFFNSSTPSILNKDDYGEYRWLANVIFYAILFPVGFCGNCLSVIVVSYIVKHQRTRRSIPDVLLGVLAGVDLFSILGVHSLSLAATLLDYWPYPYEVCVYQSFAASAYLKLEFMVQVAISVDRYVALVRPLKYHRKSSMKLVRTVIAVIFLVSIVSTTLMVATSVSSAHLLKTWNMCMHYWKMDSVPHLVILSITSLLFVTGFVSFIYCNANLVRILWQYHSQREQSVLTDLTNAVNALEKQSKNNSGPLKQDPAGMAIKPPQELPNRSPRPSYNPNGLGTIQSPNPDQINLNNMPRQSKHIDDTCNIKQGDISGAVQDTLTLTYPCNGECLHSGKHVCMADSKSDTGVSDNVNEEDKSEHDSDMQIMKKKHLESTDSADSQCRLLPRNSDDVETTSTLPDPKTTDSSKESENDASTEKLPLFTDEQVVNPVISEEEPDILRRNSSPELIKTHRSSFLKRFRKTLSSDSFKVKARLLALNKSTPVQLTQPSTDKKALQKVMSAPVGRLPNAPLPHESESSGHNPLQFNHIQRQMRKLVRKMQKKEQRQKKEILLARLVLLCASLFVLSWIPYILVTVLGWAGQWFSDVAEDVALKLIFANAVLNPVFYGLCRSNYRKGYGYVTQLALHRLSCGLVPKPGDERVFYESRKKKQRRQQQAAEMNMYMNKQRRRRVSAHALQILQTLHGRNPSSPVEKTVPEFKPSKRLQELFERYVETESSLTDSSSSIDYDALMALDLTDSGLYQNLKKVWSMCGINDIPAENADDEEDEDIEIDVDYDALVGGDVGPDEVFVNMDKEHGDVIEGTQNDTTPKLAMSSPSLTLKHENEVEKDNQTTSTV